MANIIIHRELQVVVISRLGSRGVYLIENQCNQDAKFSIFSYQINKKEGVSGNKIVSDGFYDI